MNLVTHPLQPDTYVNMDNLQRIHVARINAHQAEVWFTFSNGFEDKVYIGTPEGCVSWVSGLASLTTPVRDVAHDVAT